MNGTNSNTSGANVVTLDFRKKGPGHCLSDSTMAEIISRTDGTVELSGKSPFWTAATEPTDKTLIWWPVDPVSGAPIGQPRIYDAATSKWVLIGGTIPKVYSPRKRSNGAALIAAGTTAVATVSFASVGANYILNISLTTKGAAGYGAAPTNMNNFGYVVTSKTDGQFIVNFYNVPTGGFTMEWEAVNTDAETALN